MTTTQTEVSPAHAGMDRPLQRRLVAPAGEPRARGDGPVSLSAQDAELM